MAAFIKFEGLRGPLCGKYLDWFQVEAVEFDGRSIGLGVGAPDEKVRVGRRGTEIRTGSRNAVVSISLGSDMTLRLEARQPKSRVVTIDWTKGDKLQTALYRVILDGAMVSNVGDFGNTSGGPGPTRIGLNFEKLTFEFAASTEPHKAP